ncbi:type I polyketide synthase [Agrobacterium vitis]|uniref:type I polyketide synthase n=1 Tax=Agrobacterium vitis TaxID=373 RepID=UPI002035DC58|nr:type I polyketide synthase [Agrobacterium vitis]MCM2450198.1 KR domain-containing protein [Agrobacterium vitis]
MDGFSQRVYDVFSPIAIVGVGALFPEAKNADEYWSNIVKGKDCLKDVPETHWKISDYYDPNPSTPDKTYARRGGFIPETAFNPVEFGLPPSQLDVTDILQILSLSVAKQTFLDAGYEHAKLNREKTGVVLGITGANSLVTPLTSRLQYPLWQKVLESRGLPKAQVDDIVETLKLAYAPWEENSFPGMLGNVVAGRIANRFDLGGINCTVDAACASSLAAMRMAIDELHSGRADMMLTGGCDAENTILMYMCFSKTPAFSKKGVISPFDENSDGTLIGEGIGMMLLKRLEDAERDGDQVYAVIKGLGSASDGKFKSIYAPRAAGQVKALQRAYQQAGISPHDVDLWEAHGTGTAVGDATEVDGLKTFLKSWDNDGSSSPIALGSVKSQIGHTKAAAGAASAIKAALALQHGVLPPTINVNRPDPKLGLDETALYLNSTARPWFRDPKTAKRRVGVSAFGFGGTNFHLVLEEAPQTAKAPKLRSVLPRPIVVAAPTVAALRKRCEELLTATGETAWPFDVSIPEHHPRLGLVAADETSRRALLSEAISLLDSRPATAEWRHPKGITFRPSAFANAKLAGLFAGQGSQHPNMGRMAAVAIPALGDFVGAADTLFAKDGAQPLSQVMYPIPAFDDADRKAQEQALRRTQYAQTAIGALSAGHYRWLQNLGLKLEAVAGHSFGELTALWASGALSDADFSSLAKARGDAMAAVTGDGAGTMTAVKAGREALESLIAATKGSVHFCNLNTPKQTVVGGAVEAIEKFEADLKAASIGFVRLNVAGAFHTPQVEGAVTAFAERIDQTSFAVPQIPVYANRNGKPYAASAADVAAQLKGQLREPVEFVKIIEQMYADGIRVFIEFGPRSTLSKMTADILGDRPHLAIALDHGQPDKADAGLIEAVVDLAVAGIALESPVGTAGLIEAPARKGEINLNGMNYVSPSRKEAFAKALANPVVVAPNPVPTPPQPVAAKPLAAAPAPVRSEPAKPVAANVAFGVPAPSSAPSLKAASVEKPAEPLAQKQAVALTAPASRSSFAEKPMSILKNETSSEPAMALGGGDIVAELARSNGELHREYLKFEQSALQALVHNAGELSAAHVDMLCEIHEETNLTHREFMRSLPSLFLGQGELPAARVRTVEHEPARHEPVKRMIETAVAHAAPVAAARPAVTAKAFEPVVAPVQAPAAKPVSAAPPAPVPAKPVAAPVAQVSAPAVASAAPAAVVRETLLAVVSEKTGYPAEVSDLDMDLEADLGIDSIKRVEILGSLKERLPQMAELSPDRMGELRTLAQILELAGSASPALQASATPAAQHAAASIGAPTPAAFAPAVAAGAIRETLLAVVSEKTGYPADVIDLEMDLEADLGIDSIKRVEILGSLKERLPQMAELSPDRMGELRTLAQILALATEGAVTDAPAAPAAAPVPASVAVPALAPTQALVPEPAGLPAGAVRGALLAVVSEKTGYPTDVIDLDMDLEADLGIDSIKRVEILGALKERLPQMAELSPDRMGELRTLAQILTLAEDEASNAGEPQQKEAALASFKDGDDLIGRGVVTLLPAPLDLVTQQAFQKGAKFLLTGTDDALILALQKGLKSKGIDAVWLRFEGKVSSKAGPQLAAGKDEAELKQQFDAQGPWDGVIYVHPKTIDNALPGAESDASVLWLKRVLLLAKLSITPLTARAAQGRTVFMTLSRMDGALGYRDGSLATVASGALSGLVKTYAAEAPHIFARAVDIAPQIEDAAAADLLVQEVFDARHSITEIGLDGQGRWKPSIEAISSSDAVTVADPDELFIVTGGARGVTADCVLALASAAPRRFLLLGRSALEAEPVWAAGLETDAQLKGGALAALREGKAPVTPKLIDQTVRGVLAGREIRQLLAALEKLGSHASYLSLDISSPAISSLGDHPEIQKAAKISLVHGAGALADAAIAQKKISEMDRVFTPKIFGLAGLINALTGKPFHRVLLFSSVAGLFGNPGQADYAMANEMLNRFAASQSVKGVDVRAINWGPWLGGMVTPEIRDIFMKRGVPIIPRDIGGQFFARETAMPLPATGAVLVGGLKPINARFVPFAELPQAPRRLALSGHDWTKSLLLADHQIKGRPVVPAAFVLGLVADGLESLLPGWTFSGFDQFNVLNGLVINKDWRGDFELSLSALRAETEETIRLDVLLADGSGRPRYKADNILLRKAAFMPPQPGKALPSLEPSTPANGFYTDGTLFHGESLQMLKTYRKLETASYLFRIAQPAAIHSAALNGFADSTLLDAVSVDAVLQAALAATRLEADSPSLPMRLGSATLTSRPEPGSDWLIAARLKASRAQELDWELTGYDLDGRLQMQLVATTVKRDEAQSGSQGSKSVEAVK